MANDKLKQYLVLHQEIMEEKKQLEERLAQINDVLKGLAPYQPAAPAKVGRKKATGGETPVPFGKGKRRKRSPNGLTTNEAILKALEAGQLDVPAIVAKVSELKGKTTRATVYQGIMTLKKDGKISKVARGEYVISK